MISLIHLKKTQNLQTQLNKNKFKIQTKIFWPNNFFKTKLRLNEDNSDSDFIQYLIYSCLNKTPNLQLMEIKDKS